MSEQAIRAGKKALGCSGVIMSHGPHGNYGHALAL